MKKYFFQTLFFKIRPYRKELNVFYKTFIMNKENERQTDSLRILLDNSFLSTINYLSQKSIFFPYKIPNKTKLGDRIILLIRFHENENCCFIFSSKIFLSNIFTVKG